MSELAPHELDALLFRVLDVLGDEGIPCLVTGAFPRNAFGDGRTTRGIDVVVHPDHADASSLGRVFRSRSFDVDGPKEGSLGERLVLTGEKVPVDIWLPSGNPLHHEEFDRALEVTYRDRDIPILHPTDYVLRKLVNYHRIRRTSDDLDDAYQVLLYAWDPVDVDALLERAATHRVRDEAEELVATVREDRAQLEAGEDPLGEG